MTDRARMARDFDVFMKRIRRIFPSFEYVCVFEEQKEGCMARSYGCPACSKSLSAPWGAGEVLRPSEAVWRAVVGEGNVDISKARRHSQRNISKLASYLSKYLSKTFDAGGVKG